MKKITISAVLLITTFFSTAQIQIGNDIDGEAASDAAGTSVRLSSDGSVAAIGAYANDDNGVSSGHVRVYENNNGAWIQIGNDIDGEAIGDFSGFSVSLSSDGSVVAIGAFFNDGTNGFLSGHVRVYKNNNGIWTQIGNDVDGETAEDFSGVSVCLSNDGSILAIGSYGNNDNGNQAGQVRVYENNNGVWNQIGGDIHGEAAGDWSGISVSLSGDGSILAIGALHNDENGADAGQVRVYENTNGTWSQIGNDIDGEAAGDLLGSSVSLSGDGSILAAGAPENDGNGSNAGHVRVYENNNGVWNQIGSDIDGDAAGEESGIRISLSEDGSILAIGARYSDGNGIDAGSVNVYKNQSGAWVKEVSTMNGEAAGDRSGLDVDLSSDGNILAIGAAYNDDNGIEAGHVRIYDLSSGLSVNSLNPDYFSVYVNNQAHAIEISLKTDQTLKQVNLYNASGQYLHSAKALSISTAGLSEGIYFIELESEEGLKSAKKIIL